MATSNRNIQTSNGQDRSQPSVFVSYSHKDEEWKKRLVRQLDALVRARRIAVWHDRMIEAVDDWNHEIKKAMSDAAFAVCLVSSDYLSSEFCLNQEISFFLKRREEDGLVLTIVNQ
jgi:predicted nucleotide-binding protein